MYIIALLCFLMYFYFAWKGSDLKRSTWIFLTKLCDYHLSEDIKILQTSQLSRFHRVSHGFTAFLTVSQLGSSFLTVLQIFSGFSFKLTVFQENKQGNTILWQKKNIVGCSSTYKKLINNFLAFNSETSTKSFPGSGCPVNYQNFYEKNPSNINLIKSVFFRDSFCNNLESF